MRNAAPSSSSVYVYGWEICIFSNKWKFIQIYSTSGSKNVKKVYTHIIYDIMASVGSKNVTEMFFRGLKMNKLGIIFLRKPYTPNLCP